MRLYYRSTVYLILHVLYCNYIIIKGCIYVLYFPDGSGYLYMEPIYILGDRSTCILLYYNREFRVINSNKIKKNIYNKITVNNVNNYVGRTTE